MAAARADAHAIDAAAQAVKEHIQAVDGYHREQAPSSHTHAHRVFETG
jgi:hypothetical protein